jgi:iron complex outermembrane receptor protein
MSSRRGPFLLLIALIFFLAIDVVAQKPKFVVKIAPQSLSKALQELAAQADVQIVYQSKAAKDLESPGFSGEATLDEILNALLAGTGLTWRAVNERTVAVEPPNQSGANEPQQSEVARPPVVAEEIVVTAQRRRQDIRDVPVSVTVMSGETLEREGIVSVREIARQTPGFTGSTFNESEPILAIRGANNTFSQAGTSKPVGVFVDGVYVSRNSGSVFDLYDLEQVEILRGPQGTLFGRNVTGGAIVLSTARPQFGAATAKLDVGVGNFGAREVRGLVGGSLADAVAGKLSFIARQSDGYGSDRLAGIDQNDVDSLGFRGQLSFPLAGDAVLGRLIAEYSDESNHGRTLSTISPASANDGDIRTSEHGHPQRYERDITGLSGHLSWTSGVGDVESITAYRRTNTLEDFAFSSTAFSLLPRLNPGFPFQQIGIARDKPETLSQEFRLVSKRFGRFDYVLGAYYFDESIERQSTTIRLGGRDGDTLRDHTFDQNVGTASYAAYTDVHVALSDALDLNVGGRLTYEKKQVQVDYIDRAIPRLSFRSDTFEESWSEFSPRLALTWRPSQAVSLFGSVTEGFTAGGFNTEEDTPEVIGRPFNPETLIAYEIGTKTVWLEDRVRLNLTLFHQDYQDKQEGFLDPQFNFVIVNAAEATMDGAELEAHWRPTQRTRLRAIYSYLDATYDKFLIVHTREDRSGKFLPTSPKHSYSFGGDWRLPVGGGEAALAANYAWQDDYFTGSENRPTFLIDAYSLLDASLSYTAPSRFWRVTLWGKNLTDEEYVLIRSDFGVGGVGENFGAPRTFGLRLTLSL